MLVPTPPPASLSPYYGLLARSSFGLSSCSHPPSALFIPTSTFCLCPGPVQESHDLRLLSSLKPSNSTVSHLPFHLSFKESKPNYLPLPKTLQQLYHQGLSQHPVISTFTSEVHGPQRVPRTRTDFSTYLYFTWEETVSLSILKLKPSLLWSFLDWLFGERSRFHCTPYKPSLYTWFTWIDTETMAG